MELIRKYFPDLSSKKESQMIQLLRILPVLNAKVNVISRKDIDHLEERHILHSLSLARFFSFSGINRILDAGTGGGFPGIPLAIFFPDIEFILVDSIGKKIRLVNEITSTLGLKNTTSLNERVENTNTPVEVVVTRAVASLSVLEKWTREIIREGKNINPNGLLALKGGNLEDEIRPFLPGINVIPLSGLFEEEYFLTKKIVYLKKKLPLHP